MASTSRIWSDGATQTSRYCSTFDTSTAGEWFGGPILKNKVWFWGAMDWQDINVGVLNFFDASKGDLCVTLLQARKDLEDAIERPAGSATALLGRLRRHHQVFLHGQGAEHAPALRHDADALASDDVRREATDLLIQPDVGQTVLITIEGTNDAPVITSAAQAGTVKEDASLTATGQVTSSDVDHGARDVIAKWHWNDRLPPRLAHCEVT